MLEVAAAFATNRPAIDNVSVAVVSLDAQAVGLSALLASIWAPLAADGVVVASWWAGVMAPDADGRLRSAARFQRLVENRRMDGDVTIIEQQVLGGLSPSCDSFGVAELCGGDPGTEPFMRVQVGYFPTWTDERALLQATCPLPNFWDEFIDDVAALASTIILHPTEDRGA